MATYLNSEEAHEH